MDQRDIGYDDPPEWLEGFSLELVKRLDELVRAYGVDDPAVAVRRAELKGNPGRVFVSAGLAKHRAVMIGNQPGRVDLHRSYVRRFDGGASYVVWEHGVTVEDVQNLVSELTVLERTFGPSVDQALGQMEPGDNQVACVYGVDEQFKSRRHLAIPLPGTETAEQFLTHFDRPEELTVVRTLMGRGVCRRADLDYVLQREQVVAMVLDTYGITPEMVPQLAPGELAKVYRIVDLELDRIFDQK